MTRCMTYSIASQIFDTTVHKKYSAPSYPLYSIDKSGLKVLILFAHPD